MSGSQLTVPEKVLDLIGYSNVAMEKAAADQAALTQQNTKIASLIPKAVDAMISGERIRETEREKLAEALKDPVRTLELLIKVAVHRNPAEHTLGTPTTDHNKTANDNGGRRRSVVVGARDSGPRESDRRFLAGLGLAPPTE